MDNRGRRRVWLVVAAMLFVVAAVLMFTGQGEAPTPETPKVEFPRRMRAPERERAERRRTLVLPVQVDAGTKPERQRPRDPVLAALPRGEGKTAVVIEANALRHSPIGELLLDCLMRDGGKRLEELRNLSGVDPLQDLDRLVITDEGMMLSGNFANAKFKELLGERVSMDYGEGARVYEPGEMTVTRPDGSTVRRRSDAAVATWNNELLVIGQSPDEVKAVVDRVEGRGPDEPPAIGEGSTYGEMYGVLSVEQLARLLPKEQAELAQRIRDVAQNVELHVDASGDVAMVAEVRGANGDEVTDLGKTLGAALSMARIKAQAEGEKDLAQLLDFARVQPDGTSFKLEMAVPLDVIQQRLAFCKEERQAAEATER
ncbi:hypothetical protein [Corallococcus macrosporus]|uniref:Uncharacterized protein n=1 Tax=Myxococcus fulvus (strain ATCC BAA-855 / HW-1) TaxID=483219 RepID=F8CJ22_MYXFH|nr:hypothetical protein [Corallococcus macrosporus]AEI67621.1 hypothetical protein LILAB_28700 [Corallococcus macrosporus]